MGRVQMIVWGAAMIWASCAWGDGQEGPWAGDPAAADGAEQVSDEPVPVPGGPRLSTLERVERLEETMWWNHQKLVASLGLEDTQRQQMRATFVAYFTARLEARTEARGPDPFRRAVVAADLDRARVAITERAERAAAAATVDAQMILDVLGVLRAEQLEELANRYPRVLRAAWFTELSGGRDRRGRSGGRRTLRAVPPQRPEPPSEPPG